ncbi:MAG: TRAP transporter small permease [Armatimonadota bacterium]|nr:TRAP transporter small permease [Armatimonadota bacterium]MDR7533748.1 TRAP transporter small permease [Armatimonadota bacterium]MDR7535045.1 TRAP transporter small permease [Armatimonadota bacterium]
MAWIDRVVRFLIGLLMAGILIVVLLAVFFRYVLNAALFWGEEVARYLTVWVIFLSMSVAYGSGAHVRVTALLDRVHPRARRRADLVAAVLEVALLGLLTWYGVVLAANNLQRGQRSPALQIPIGWVYLAVPAGAGLSLLHAVARVGALLGRWSQPMTAEQGSAAGLGDPLRAPGRSR